MLHLAVVPIDSTGDPPDSIRDIERGSAMSQLTIKGIRAGRHETAWMPDLHSHDSMGLANVNSLLLVLVSGLEPPLSHR